MRQTDFTLAKVSRRLRRKRQLLHAAVVADIDEDAIYRLDRHRQQLKKDKANVVSRMLHIKTKCFNINVFSDEESLKNFRFRRHEIGRLSELVSFTQGITKRCQYACDAVTAACIVARRLAAPCRWYDVELMFGMPYYTLSEVFWEALEMFIDQWGHVLTNVNVELLAERADMYAQAISNEGAPLDSCFGFMDCTKLEMSRPGGDGAMQRSCYSGHKRFHCLVYQSITTPDGLIFHMYGPEVGRRHDMTLYQDSGIDLILQQHMVMDGRQFYLYADAAYVLKPWMQIAFNPAFATPPQIVHNHAMNAARVAVEWSYKDVKQMWSSQDFKRMLKVRQAPVSLMYLGAALLWNIKVCMQHGGQVQQHFGCPPPTLDRYLRIEL